MVYEDFPWDEVRERATAEFVATTDDADYRYMFYDPEVVAEDEDIITSLGRDIAYRLCPDDEAFEDAILAQIDYAGRLP